MEALSVATPDGINWHVKRFSNPSSASDQEPEYIMLIPSGEGDADNLISTAAHIHTLLPKSTVMAVDMPGFSRSEAPASAYTPINPKLIAEQIITLLDTFSIPNATFWGPSSGANAVLTLLTLFPERVNRAIVHEAPFFPPPPFVAMKKESDEAIREYCRNMFRTEFIEKENGGRQKWAALGGEYHRRLDVNYVTWIRQYVGELELSTRELISKDSYAGLKQKPLFWTVGGLSDSGPGGLWEMNFEIAEIIGLKVDTQRLRCGHFPQVTIPEPLAEWIVDCISDSTV